MNKRIFICLAMVLLFGTTVFGIAKIISGNNDSDGYTTELSFGDVVFPGKNNNEDDEVIASGSIAGIGTTLEEYYDRSSDIVIARVVDNGKTVVSSSEEIDFTLTFTRPKLEVLEVYKGDLRTGDIVTTEEMGYTVDGKDVQTMDGVPLMKKGMMVLLFFKNHVVDENEEIYVINGVYQGKMFIDSTGDIHQSAFFGSGAATILSMDTTPYAEMSADLKEICAAR